MIGRDNNMSPPEDSSHLSSAAMILFDWLALRDELPATACDAVIGFGHFDLGIPLHCGELQAAGAARHIIFTGGLGAGTADLGRPEADAFLDTLANRFPALSRDQVVVENRSTNTGENIRLTRDLLETTRPALAFGKGIRSALLVANPCRQRRVWLTWRQLMPTILAFNAPAADTYAKQRALFANKGLDFHRQLLGEYERIRDYPQRGWIIPSVIPDGIAAAARCLSG